MQKLKGKKAVVTGGSRGIGRAICIELAQQGANVIVNFAGNQEAANETVEICKNYGVNAVAIKSDLRNEENCKQFSEECVEVFEEIDILVNNAGISNDKLLFSVKEDDLQEILDVNLKSAFFCSKYFLKHMRKRKNGRVINMSSVVGLHGNIGQSMYAASKAGLIGLTKSLAKEFASRNITVNAIAPGFIRTEMTESLSENIKEAILTQIPMGKMGKPEDVAELVSFLSSEGAGYITGQVMAVDGGMGI